MKSYYRTLLDHTDNGLVVHNKQDGSGNNVTTTLCNSGDLCSSTIHGGHKLSSTRIETRMETSSWGGVDTDMDQEMSSYKSQVPQTVMTPMVPLGRQSSQVSDDNDDVPLEHLNNNKHVHVIKDSDRDVNMVSHDQPVITRTRRSRNRKKNRVIQADGNDGDENERISSARATGARPKIPNIASTVRSLGYADNEIAAALLRLQDANVEVTHDSLIDMSFDVRMESLLNPEPSGSAAETDTGDGSNPLQQTTEAHILTNSTGTAASEEVVTERHVKKPVLTPEERYKRRVALALKNKKEELSDAIEALTYKCRVCNDADANILLLPCAHLVCCSNCVDDVRRCPLARCNRIVRGTKEVYYA